MEQCDLLFISFFLVVEILNVSGDSLMYERFHFSRYAMYRSIEHWAYDNRCVGKGKTVGGGSPICELWPQVEFETTNYPNVNVHSLPWEKESLDILVADQVLEHVKYPWKAASEMCRVLKKEGILVCTTCFLQRWHPPDVYFGFHPSGLRILFDPYLSDMQVGGWGNREANDKINFDDKWRHRKVEGDRRMEQLVNENDPKAPFATWVMGRK